MAEENKVVVSSVEEGIKAVDELIDKGFNQKIHYRGSSQNIEKIYLYPIEGESAKIEFEGMTADERKQVLDYARKRIKEVNKAMIEEDEDYTKNKDGGGRRETTGSRAGVGRRLTLEMLDRSHAQLVKDLAETVSWFSEAIHKIGWITVFIAMQHAKIPRDQMYDAVRKFRDPDEFVEFIIDHFSALLEASEDAFAIERYKKDLEILEAKLDVIKACFYRMKKQRDDLLLAFQTATSCMCEDCMRKFAIAMMNLMMLTRESELLKENKAEEGG